MQPRKVRYAVVGLGNIARGAVLPAFAQAKESSELAALVSSDGDKLRDLSARYGVDATGSYDDLERIIRDAAIDAVYVAVPNALHRGVTERAAKAGAHVLCEKPMATTVADCEAMIQATRDHGVKLMIACRLRFEASNLAALDRMRNGEIGDPRIFSSVFSHQVRAGDIRTRADLGGGALFDIGIYCLHAARYVFGAEPLSVFAMQTVGTEERFRHVDEMTTAVLRFPGDRVAQFTASQGAADLAELRVVGTRGNIELEPAYDCANAREVTSTLRHFSRCIVEQTTPEPSGEEGLADVRVIDAIVRAAATREIVDLPSFDRSARSSGVAMRNPLVGWRANERA